MKIQEKKEVTREEWTTIDIKCDLCGHSTLDKSKWPNYEGSQDIDTNEVKIKHSIVNFDHYDPGGDSKDIEIDCCPACWEEMVLPHLRLLGLKIEYKEDFW